MTIGLGAQSLAFVIIARHMGRAEFGQLATVTAAASLGTAWAQLDTAEAMRRRVGRERLGLSISARALRDAHLRLGARSLPCCLQSRFRSLFTLPMSRWPTSA